MVGRPQSATKLQMVFRISPYVSSPLSSIVFDVVTSRISHSVFGAAWTEQDPTKKKEIIDKALVTGREKFISRFNVMLEANGGFFVGSNLTWADIVVATSIEFYEKLWGISIAEGYPAVEKLLNTVFNAKGIKEWIQTRPVTKM